MHYSIIKFVRQMVENIDKGEITGADFFDLRRVFVVVDHEILLKY